MLILKEIQLKILITILKKRNTLNKVKGFIKMMTNVPCTHLVNLSKIFTQALMEYLVSYAL